MTSDVSSDEDAIGDFSVEACMAAIIDYRGKTPRKTTAGIPLITAKIVKNGRIEKPEEFIDHTDYDAWMRRGLPRVGDVLLTTEAPLGEVAQLTCDRVALAQRIILLRGEPDRLLNDYLKYLLQSPDVQSQLSARASGTTVVGIKQSELRKVVLRLPSVAYQGRVARILKAFDDKIEHNRKTSETLERLARAIFRAWFVDFEPVKAKVAGASSFPSMPQDVFDALPTEFVDSPIGMIPRGWRVGRLSELAELPYGKPLKEQDRIPGRVPVFGSNGLIGWHDRALVSRPGIIIGRKGNPGIVSRSAVPFYCIDTTFYVEPKNPEIGGSLLFYLLMHLNLGRLTADSAVPGLNRNMAYAEHCIVPPSSIVCGAGALLDVFATYQHQLETESRNLAELRDYLLPKLLSGKVRVKDAERIAESTP